MLKTKLHRPKNTNGDRTTEERRDVATEGVPSETLAAQLDEGRREETEELAVQDDEQPSIRQDVATHNPGEQSPPYGTVSEKRTAHRPREET